MIPRTDESEQNRKLRLMGDKVDELTAQVQQQQRPLQGQCPPNEIPAQLQFAFAVVQHFHQAGVGLYRCGPFGEMEQGPVEFGAEELMVLGSASNLLSAYFDSFNPRLQQHAPQKAKDGDEQKPAGGSDSDSGGQRRRKVRSSGGGAGTRPGDDAG